MNATPFSKAVLAACYRMLAEAVGGGARLVAAAARGVGATERADELAERLALPPTLAGLPRGGIWLHGASLGELRSLRPLIAELRRDGKTRPLFVTTSSLTGREWARERLDLPVRLAPWDASGPLERFLSVTRPALHLFVETELWPLRLEGLAARGIPVALVSARLSPDKWSHYRRLRGLYGPALARLALLAPSGEADRERFLALGACPRSLGPLGSLKWDAAPEAPSAEECAALRNELGLDPARPWIVFGSMHPGEASTLLAPLAEGSRLPCGVVVAPRHPQRFDEIARELETAGFPAHRASTGAAPPDAQVVLLDRMGVLAKVYALSRAAVLGGTFRPVGGHSPLEAAASSCPIVAGPAVFQQLVLVETLAKRGGLVLVDDALQAAQTLRAWLADPEAARRAGQAARSEVEAQAGLVHRLTEALRPLLGTPA